MAKGQTFITTTDGRRLHRKSKDLPDGYFDAFECMAIFVDDLTPNNMHTGAVQVPRKRIDHFYDAKGRETKN